MHFKLCSMKFDYVIVSWVISAYYLLLAVYIAHQSFKEVHRLPKDDNRRFQGTFDYATRLVIELVGTAFLAWGIAFRDTTGLLIWLCVAISFVIRNMTAKILYLFQDEVVVSRTDSWMHWEIIILDILASFIIFKFFFALRNKTAMLKQSWTSVMEHSFTFKIGLQKMKFVTASLLITVYVLLSCTFEIFRMLLEKKNHQSEHFSYFEIPEFYPNIGRLVVKIILATILVYGSLWKKSYALLTWTCITLSLLATIKMEKEKTLMFDLNDLVLDSFLYFCCVLDTISLFVVFNFFLNVRDSTSRLKNCEEITRITAY